MLEERGIAFSYRDYRSQPLTEDELRWLFDSLQMRPRDLLRRRDRAFRELGLSGDEDNNTLISFMHERPTLLERPIGIAGGKAVVGRPPERLLELEQEKLKRACVCGQPDKTDLVHRLEHVRKNDLDRKEILAHTSRAQSRG